MSAFAGVKSVTIDIEASSNTVDGAPTLPATRSASGKGREAGTGPGGGLKDVKEALQLLAKRIEVRC